MACFCFSEITVKADNKSEHQRIYGQTLYFTDAEYKITHNVHAFLFIGTDDSGNVEAADTEDYLGQMADFLLLLVQDRSHNTYGFLQINRDTMTNVPFMDTEGNGEDTAFEQICISHWYGGNPEMSCRNTVYTVSELLGGIEIEGFYSINMHDIGTLNNAVGGVQVTLEDDFSAEDPAMTKGTTLTLTDEQAERFVRGRMSIGDGLNTSRMRRQKQYMDSFKDKLFQLMRSDPAFIGNMLDALEDVSVTDMPKNRWSVIANQIYKADYQGIMQLEGEDKEGDTLKDGMTHAEFYADEESIEQTMALLCGIDEKHIERY